MRHLNAVRHTLYQETVDTNKHTYIALYLWELEERGLMNGIASATYDLVIVRLHPLGTAPSNSTYGSASQPAEVFYHPVDANTYVPDAIRLAIEIADHYKTYAAAPEWFGKAKGYNKEQEDGDE